VKQLLFCALLCRSASNPQIAPRMVRTISNLHSASLPRDSRLADYDTIGEFMIVDLIIIIMDYYS